jgi:membrane associated rhomboid family serine protease
VNPYIRSPRRTSADAIPNVIFVLLIANGLMFALQQFGNRFLVVNFALWPAGVPGSPFMPWQLVTYAFLHGGIFHIGFNMLALWMFGRELELMMGTKRFLIYYFSCVVGAAVVQLVVAGVQGGIYPTIGASGGVFGILLAYGMAFPNRMIMLLFPPIPMKAKYFVILYGVFELYLGIAGAAPGVAHFAHLGGMLFGFLLLQYWSHLRRR